MNMDQEFDSIYQKIYDASYSRLAEVKDKNRKFLGIFCLCLIILNFILYLIPQTKYLSVITAGISLCVLVFFVVIGNQSYTRAYKKCVIEGLVKAYNPNNNYDPMIGIGEMEYRRANYDNDFNEFTSEDRIYGRFETGDAFQLSEVTTTKVTVTRNEQGVESESRLETFRGMFGVVYLEKNTMMNIGIYGDSAMRKYRRDRVEVDSSEFEKYYDLVTDDKINAMRIFTADLLEKYIDIKRSNRNGVEVKIEWDRVYFRFRCGEMFEPPMFVKGLKREHLKTFYNQIYYPLELLEKTVECLNEIQ